MKEYENRSENIRQEFSDKEICQRVRNTLNYAHNMFQTISSEGVLQRMSFKILIVII